MNAVLRKLALGAAAGILSTGTMSLVMAGAHRAGFLGEPPPRKLTRRILARLGLPRPRGRALTATWVASHVAYGGAMGALYAFAPARTFSSLTGALFGASVWGASYRGWIPRVRLMPPPAWDRPGRPTSMLLAHFVYGATLGAIMRRVDPGDDLRDHVAVVCGASRGLGRAIAHQLAAKGARVAICARNAADLERTRTELAATGAMIFAESCDLQNQHATREFLSNVERALGPIDIVVANAATMLVGPVETTRPSHYREALRSIFESALNPTLAALPGLRNRHSGTLVFITSIGAKIGVPHLAPYSAAKFATIGFAEALRAEVARDGIRVLTVVPGLMRTGSHLRSTFRGKPEAEASWLSAAAIAPALSIDADAAARRIVRAIAQRDTELVYTGPARAAALIHGIAPVWWSKIAALAARVLPHAPRSSQMNELEGFDALSDGALTRLLRERSFSLAARHNELGATRLRKQSNKPS